MTKIKKLIIKGLRGINDEISISLNSHSILLYGENGSGKSSITDAIEWFYYDKISHLSNEEIGKKGIEGLRNIFLDDSDDGYIKIEYTKSEFNSSKTISLSNSKLISNYSNNSPTFNSFLEKSQKEQIYLRYGDLVSFILATKTEKLNTLSAIIGFSEVIKTRDILRKTLNALRREIKNSNFTSQIGYQQSQLIEQLGQNIVSDKQYFDTINIILEPLKLKKRVNTLNEIDEILELLKKPEDIQLVEQQLFWNKVKATVAQLIDITKKIDEQYEEYYQKYQNIISDIDKLNKIKLEALLSEGERVLKEEIIKDEICPLCLQPKNRLDLLRELQERIEELKKYKEEKSTLNELKSQVQSNIIKAKSLINNLSSEFLINLDQNKELKLKIEQLNKDYSNYEFETNVDIITGKMIKPINDLSIDESKFQELKKISSENLEKLKTNKKGDSKFEIHSKILLSKNAYLEIKRLKNSKELLEKQQYTLEIIYAAFIKKMEDGFKSFLDHLSNDINELYVFMNPGEHIEDINLIPIKKNDEFAGITIQFKFFENEVNPPNKYLSESHLNCLGLAFFLASVKAFNKKNKFFILDDVISSFDSNHRVRFAHLLVEKFSDYQIILMTHEKNWFDYVAKMVKGKNWLINTFKWRDKHGPVIDINLPSLKEQIEKLILNNELDSLGNKIRKYLESLLKDIAFHLSVMVKFLFNDKNEDRMANELLSALKGHLKKHAGTSIDTSPIDRLIGSTFIGNKASHDSTFKATMGDFKAFWSDVLELRNSFYCENCKKYVSIKYYDSVNKKIRCYCGKIEHAWR
ncbi:SMC domain protein [Caldithrix abyssi DSM 13497]|uniref:RecF/RecN/SMC N terminal domain-containing protein n=1 Tax=Caldithrix abyssi DSM 13497 TaxID=880073 RepID=H1XTB2_CALAY|nr:SMC domain protein [Caldithrix abyssi]APF20297.1 RecF/RecN/SMC N terminal domain-containing protein [Caldithrix abyssi DSM 13497]EHO40345.1 SMC domain protein [Caldithrix abyssi DSM 13497]